MKTILVAAVALVLGVAAAEGATFCARKRGRPVLRAACRSGEERVEGRVCARKNGQLVLRAACRAGERPFAGDTLAVTGPKGPVGPPGPAGDAARFPIRIVDADQQDAGEIAHFHPARAWVRIRRGPLPEPVLFSLEARGFAPTVAGGLAVFYRAADCAGTPYIHADGTDVARAQVYGTAAYYSRAPQIAELQIASYEVDPGGRPCPSGSTTTARGACCGNETGTVTFVQPAVRVDLASLGLVPPFRAVAR